MSKVIDGIELGQNTLERIDEWRAGQLGQLSQTDAAKRLIEIGLAVAGKGGVRFSDGEKLIMMMLCDLYQHQSVKGDIDPEFIQETLWGGHYWGLQWQYGGILNVADDDPNVLSETLDILEMWYFIESSYTALSEEDKTKVKEEASISGKDVRFIGFDGNNDAHYSIAKFLVNKMERFVIFKDRSLNSHTITSISRHRCMLPVFKSMLPNLAGRDLSVEQIIKLLRAQRKQTEEPS